MKNLFFALAVVGHLFSTTAESGRSPSRGEAWRVAEWVFVAEKDYSAGGGDAVPLDMVFRREGTAETLTRPAFWDGGRVFRVRFAPTAVGAWSWRVSCATDKTLDGRVGRFSAEPYEGPLDIYRRGFVRTVPGKKHFTYADGTPFFYLGDTHWGMYREEIDSPGPFAGSSGATSHFRHVVSRRAEQGFTVYQSEPIDPWFDVRDGKVDASDIPGLRRADGYYRAIADAGLVHANAEFFFASEMRKAFAEDAAAIERVCRYWNARFGAYPVMWTLAQEIDNDFYREQGRPCHFYTVTNNPWMTVAKFLHKHDAYGHPLSGHQENADYTTVNGDGAKKDPKKRPDLGRSIFADPAVAKSVGHDWWAAQWTPSLVSTPDPKVTREYWASERPAVNYESRYCYLWTKDFGARAQGWISFLNGFCGYGYGAIGHWLYKSRYDTDSKSDDGVDRISPTDKMVPWYESLEFPSAIQMGYMKTFLCGLPWWKLAPDLGRGRAFAPKPGCSVSAASCGDELYVLYFNSTNTVTGTLRGCRPQTAYAGTWFDPRFGKSMPPFALKSDAVGQIPLPDKPDSRDWVFKASR